MTLFEELQDYVKTKNNYQLLYGIRSYLNLKQVENINDIYLFVIPNQTIFDKDTLNETISYVFMLVKASSIGDDYQTKYLENISLLYPEARALAHHFLRCTHHKLESISWKEIVNKQAENFDGLQINVTFKARNTNASN